MKNQQERPYVCQINSPWGTRMLSLWQDVCIKDFLIIEIISLEQKVIAQSMKSTWKCITLATVDYGSSIGCLREDQRLLFLIISAVFFLWILVKPSIQADQQIFSTRAKHQHLSTAIVCDLYLMHTHLGSCQFRQLSRPSSLQNLSLPCMPPTW